jgi:hypothetical protein
MGSKNKKTLATPAPEPPRVPKKIGRPCSEAPLYKDPERYRAHKLETYAQRGYLIVKIRALIKAHALTSPARADYITKPTEELADVLRDVWQQAQQIKLAASAENYLPKTRGPRKPRAPSLSPNNH